MISPSSGSLVALLLLREQTGSVVKPTRRLSLHHDTLLCVDIMRGNLQINLRLRALFNGRVKYPWQTRNLSLLLRDWLSQAGVASQSCWEQIQYLLMLVFCCCGDSTTMKRLCSHQWSIIERHCELSSFYTKALLDVETEVRSFRRCENHLLYMHQEYKGIKSCPMLPRCPYATMNSTNIVCFGYYLTATPWLQRKAVAAKSGLNNRCDCEEEMHDSHMKDS